MANPLQPKIIKTLRVEYGAYVVNLVASSVGGDMDLLACINRKVTKRGKNSTVTVEVGVFYGFEVKWASDKPSELQKKKINRCIDAGGKAYFVHSVEELRDILDNNLNPVYYDIKPSLEL